MRRIGGRIALPRSLRGATLPRRSAVPFRPNALSRLKGIAKLHKPTAGEVRVIDVVLKVNGVRAMAKLLGLLQSTVKTHLQNVLRNAGTTRQSDLVKLVAGMWDVREALTLACERSKSGPQVCRNGSGTSFSTLTDARLTLGSDTKADVVIGRDVPGAIRRNDRKLS